MSCSDLHHFLPMLIEKKTTDTQYFKLYFRQKYERTRSTDRLLGMARLFHGNCVFISTEKQRSKVSGQLLQYVIHDHGKINKTVKPQTHGGREARSYNSKIKQQVNKAWQIRALYESRSLIVKLIVEAIICQTLLTSSLIFWYLTFQKQFLNYVVN